MLRRNPDRTDGRRGSISAIAIAAALITCAGASLAIAEDAPPAKEAAAIEASPPPAPTAAAPAASTTPAPPAEQAAPAPPAAQAPKPKRKKVQEVDPHRLEIEGRIESPKSTFILEAGGALIPDVGSLDGLLRGPWIPPIDKEALDHYVVTTIEKGDRP